MRIYVLKLKRLLMPGAFFIAIIATLTAVPLLMNLGISEVFSPNRLLPIYSVEGNEKVASITFDCAWGAVN